MKAASDLYFAQVPVGQMANFAYLIGSRETRECLLVDPAWQVDALLDQAEADGMRVGGALVTHYHQDHVGGSIFGMEIEGLARLMARAPVPVHVNAREAEGVRKVTGLSASDLVRHEGGDTLELGGLVVRLLHTPGHTPGSQCFLVEEAGAPGRLVSGDTLFLGSCGRVDLPGGDPEALFDSLRNRLGRLPDDTLLYPGHFYAAEPFATLGEQKRTNPYLRVARLEDFLSFLGYCALVAPPQAPAPLPLLTLLVYVAPSMGVSFVTTLFVVMYLKFATDRLEVSAFAMGGIFLVAKLWNALADPLVGSWSDRTQSRLGRRKAWLAAGSLPLALFFWMAWAPPAALEGVPLTLWVLVAVLGTYTAFTTFEVPHAALGVELTHHHASRTRLFGAKYLVRAIGLGLATTWGVALVNDPEQGRANGVWLGAFAGFGTAALILASLPLLPRERSDYQGRGGVSVRAALRDVARNREARLLLAVFFVEALGLGGLTVLVPYVTEYVMKRPDLTEEMLGGYVLSTFLAIPLWVLLARRFEKRKLWLYAMVQGGAGFGLLFWLGENDWPLMLASSVLAGSAQACGNSIGQALKADVIDLDEYETGQRKEGAYFAAWSFVNKLGNAVLASSAAFALGFAGFVPNVEQTALVKATLVFLMGGMPLLGYAVGALLFSRFSLSEPEHARIRRELDARAASAAG